LAFISGHAHTYERFLKNEKMFIISGGGGGPRVTLNTGLECHTDLYKGKSPRPFNYLLLTETNDGVNFTVKGLNKNGKDFFILEEFNLSYPNNPDEKFVLVN
jgi:hypothetical protein